MKVAIVDDEPLARDRLRRMISEFPGYEIVGEAADGARAIELIRAEEPDVVLLDVRIGDMDGMQVARAVTDEPMPPAIIFITAYPEHALSAFDARGDAFLVKPVRKEKLREALQRVRRPTRAQQHGAVGGPHGDGRPPKREFVLATTRDGLLRIPAAEIVYFVADQKYTTVCHLHGEVLIEESLKTLEDDFAPWFLRIHRKALVATRFIASLERSDADEAQHWLRVRHSGALLPVSRRRLAEVRRFLTDENQRG
jgi:two-component system response regulator AlgR